MIRVRYLPIDGREQWRAVTVPLLTGDRLCVGFVRFTVGGSTWIARVRQRRVNDHSVPVCRWFADRTSAAEWILVAGGYAQHRPQIEQVAA